MCTMCNTVYQPPRLSCGVEAGDARDKLDKGTVRQAGTVGAGTVGQWGRPGPYFTRPGLSGMAMIERGVI